MILKLPSLPSVLRLHKLLCGMQTLILAWDSACRLSSPFRFLYYMSHILIMSIVYYAIFNSGTLNARHRETSLEWWFSSFQPERVFNVNQLVHRLECRRPNYFFGNPKVRWFIVLCILP